MNDQMKREQLCNFLDAQSVDYRLQEDDISSQTALQGAESYGISLSETAPTLILKTKLGYIAAILPGNRRIVFKALKQQLSISDISMADPQTVFEVTGARIGYVSLINTNLTTIIDKSLLENRYCYGGCGIAHMTLRINVQDLIRVTNAQVLDFTELRS